MTDNFNGDTAHLIRSIEALLELDAKGVLRPHGIGGHARTLLEAAAVRLAASGVTGASPTLAELDAEADAIAQNICDTDGACAAYAASIKTLVRRAAGVKGTPE